MSIVTDSTLVETPKDPSTSTIFQLYSLVASKNETEEMRERFQKGGTGYGDFKKQLFEKVWEYFAPMPNAGKKFWPTNRTSTMSSPAARNARMKSLIKSCSASAPRSACSGGL